MRGKIACWERIITENLFTFEQAEHDSEDVHLAHYAGIRLLSDVPLLKSFTKPAAVAVAATTGAPARKESMISSLLMRRREDGAQLRVTCVTIAFESHEEPLVTLTGAYQCESGGKANTKGVPVCTWQTMLSVWQQFAQRTKSNPNQYRSKMRIAFACFQYSYEYPLKDRVHRVYLGPIQLLTDVRGFGVYLDSDLLRVGSLYNHAVRNKHTGEMFFYEQSESASHFLGGTIVNG